MEKHKILWVDDDIDDLDLFVRIVREIAPETDVDTASNGQEALDYLNVAKRQQAIPCLVVLDMNMPKMNGRDTLVEMKKQPDYQNIPVIVFTTSSSPLDKAFCDKYGVEMVTKPLSVENIRTLAGKFLGICGPK
ncbi:response regulator [Flaviaesturariibacter terrae]